MSVPARRVLIPLMLVLAALAGACRSSSEPPAVAPDVWAVVNGHEIKKDDVEKAYRRADQGKAGSDYEIQTAKLNLLNELMLQEIFLGQARTLKIELPESELDTAFTEAKKGLAEDAFNKELAARNLTAADMRDMLRKDLLVRKLLDQEVTKKVAVTDKDITDFYEANKPRFSRAEDAYRIAQIVVTAGKEPQIANRTGDDATSPQAAAAKVKMLMDQLKSGSPFDEVAMDYSEDAQSAPRGGDVGLIPLSALGRVPPPLRDAVLKAAPGDVNVVSMEGGYTIVALVAKEAKGQDDPSMPQVREGITTALRGPREQLLRTAFVNAARDRATVVNYLARRLLASEGKLDATPASAPASAKP